MHFIIDVQMTEADKGLEESLALAK